MNPAPSAEQLVLRVRDLSVTVRSGDSDVPIVNAVSFDAFASRVLGVVGESGSGKTMMMRAIFGLLPPEAGVSGGISYRDQVLEPGHVGRESLLGTRFGMVFQDARSSLHPTFSIGRQLEWALRRSRLPRSTWDARKRVLLEMVGLPATPQLLRMYPHNLSGGMCQRAALAIAIAPEPDLLVADEATNALDPTIQLQVADLLAGLSRQLSLTLILITHDMGLVRYLCDDVIVMREGRIVESGSTSAILDHPEHDYTRLLLSGI